MTAVEVVGEVIVDGTPVPAAEASVSVLDAGLLRGYGCFEALRSYGGHPFRMAAHLDRLEFSAAALRLDLPDRSRLEAWVAGRCEVGGDAVVRVVVTAGPSRYIDGGRPRVLVFAETLPDLPAAFRLLPVPAPWHSGGAHWELTGAKTLSYAPNMAASRTAEAAGFDDALLLSRDGHVLEGPTYAIGWFRDGRFHTPADELGVLASITEAAALDVVARLGIEHAGAVARLDDLSAADEVVALSTVREVAPVVAIGDRSFDRGPLTARLAAGFRGLVEAEIA